MKTIALPLWAGVAGALFATAAAAQDTANPAPDQDEIVVTGTRGVDRTALETSVPVDVFSIGDLTVSGRRELNQILAVTVPSFNFNQTAINDGTDIIRPATLRGLAPDQTLVLVNGKRRHASALVNINGSVGRGSAAVDLNSIPTAALRSVQVLRDGASAQYGSDAIAGVINVLLRDDSSGGGLSAVYGANVTHIDAVDRNETDGETITIDGWKGLPLGEDGHITISGQYQDRNPTNRAGLDPRQQYPTLAGGGPDPREATFNRLNHRYGNGNARNISLLANAGLPISPNAELYSWFSFQDRNGDAPGFYRRALDSRNVPAIYPDGFLPVITGDVTDYSAAGGVRGNMSGWDYDLSLVFGDNKLDYGVVNSLNTSLGPTSPTEFDAGALKYRQYVANFDLTRQVDMGVVPVSVSVGSEYRNENYQITAGEPASYITGTFPGPGGSQVFPGFQPSNAVDNSRHSYAFYLDLESQVTSQLFLSAAVRYEDYSDFGNTVRGKVTARYDFTPWLALRGAWSNGFRAPSLQQQFFTATSTNFINGVPFEVGTFPATSSVGQALGGKQLQAEKSTNYSAGVVLRPMDGLFVTVDAYLIKLKDQIVLSENLQGAPVDTALANAGITGVQVARFFINGLDTRTQGVDIVGHYQRDIGDLGNFTFSAGINLSDGKINKLPTNDVLPTLTLFGRVNQLRFQDGTPSSKYVLTTDWTRGILSGNLRATRYGDVLVANSSAANDYTLNPKWILDLSVNAQVTDNISVGIGADNLFDTYPTQTPANLSFNGIFPYSSSSPFGFSGRFLYARASLSF